MKGEANSTAWNAGRVVGAQGTDSLVIPCEDVLWDGAEDRRYEAAGRN